MSARENRLHEQLRRDLSYLKLHGLAENYSELLAHATVEGLSLLQTLAQLMAHEAADRERRSLERRIKRAREQFRRQYRDTSRSAEQTGTR